MKWVVTLDQIGAKPWGIIGQVIGEVEAGNVIDAKARASVEFSPTVKQALHVQSRISWRYDQQVRKELATRTLRRRMVTRDKGAVRRMGLRDSQHG